MDVQKSDPEWNVVLLRYFNPIDAHESGLIGENPNGIPNNSKMAQVDLFVGGQKKGTFYYGGSYPAEYTIKNVTHGLGNQEVKLVVTSDDGTWDGYVDYLTIK